MPETLHLSKDQKVSREELEFSNLCIYQLRGNKYFIISDTFGNIMYSFVKWAFFDSVLHKNLKYKSQFYTESASILQLIVNQ